MSYRQRLALAIALIVSVALVYAGILWRLFRTDFAHRDEAGMRTLYHNSTGKPPVVPQRSP